MDLTCYTDNFTVILCASREEAKLLAIMAAEQLSISGADEMLDAWNFYKEDTCYKFARRTWSYCSLEWFMARGYDANRFSDIFAQLEGEDGNIEDLLI